MEELQISGKRYVSARRVAEDQGYNSDYIGQLIRGGKISGQKVGRAWYVDASAAEAYFSNAAEVTERATTTVAQAQEQEAQKIPILSESRQDEIVEKPRPKKPSLRFVAEQPISIPVLKKNKASPVAVDPAPRIIDIQTQASGTVKRTSSRVATPSIDGVRSKGTETFVGNTSNQLGRTFLMLAIPAIVGFCVGFLFVSESRLELSGGTISSMVRISLPDF